MPAPTEIQPDYPNRIVIYLKAPTRAIKGPDGAVLREAQEAQINTCAFNDPALRAEEDDFLTGDRLPKTISPHDRVCFTISAANLESCLHVWGLPVGWEGGCRLVPHFLLGNKGDSVSDVIGLRYELDEEYATRDLHCSFSGAGLLICTDLIGGKFEIDLAKPGTSALCLTVTADPKSRGRVVFPNESRFNLDIFQPAPPPPSTDAA